jgi:hypothetical protein
LAPKGRSALAWGLFSFACFQAALAVVMERQQPQLRDPEFGYKLSRLRDRLAEEPGRQLCLVLGSSRAGLGFRPDALRAFPPSLGNQPLVFNAALTGAGPMMELLCLRRVLRAGIRPDRVILEVLPPILHENGPWAEMRWVPIDRLGWEDVQLLSRYHDRPALLWQQWIVSRLTCWFSNRFGVMSYYAPGWLPWDCRQDGWLGMDGFGWLPYTRTAVDAEEYQRGVDYARRQYAPAFVNYHISEKPDRALRELLELCRREQIYVLLLLMPEGSLFQSWYSHGTRAEVDAYLASLCRRYGVPLVDARSWMEDTAFFDSHHLLPAGATAFTERFAREVLPLLGPGKTEPVAQTDQTTGADLAKQAAADLQAPIWKSALPGSNPASILEEALTGRHDSGRGGKPPTLRRNNP